MNQKRCQLLRHLRQEVTKAETQVILRKTVVIARMDSVKESAITCMTAPTSIILSFASGISLGVLSDNSSRKTVQLQEKNSSTSDSLSALMKTIKRVTISTIITNLYNTNKQVGDANDAGVDL